MYGVTHQTGAMNWTLGGKALTFRMGKNTAFMFQHHARMVGANEITIFDDGGRAADRSQALAPDHTAARLRHRTASLVLQDEHQPGLLAEYEGSVQSLANGDDLVGWGRNPYLPRVSLRLERDANHQTIGGHTGQPAHDDRVRELERCGSGGAVAGAGRSDRRALRGVTSARKTAFETPIRRTAGRGTSPLRRSTDGDACWERRRCQDVIGRSRRRGRRPRVNRGRRRRAARASVRRFA